MGRLNKGRRKRPAISLRQLQEKRGGSVVHCSNEGATSLGSKKNLDIVNQAAITTSDMPNGATIMRVGMLSGICAGMFVSNSIKLLSDNILAHQEYMSVSEVPEILTTFLCGVAGFKVAQYLWQTKKPKQAPTYEFSWQDAVTGSGLTVAQHIARPLIMNYYVESNLDSNCQLGSSVFVAR